MCRTSTEFTHSNTVFLITMSDSMSVQCIQATFLTIGMSLTSGESQHWSAAAAQRHTMFPEKFNIFIFERWGDEDDGGRGHHIVWFALCVLWDSCLPQWHCIFTLTLYVILCLFVFFTSFTVYSISWCSLFTHSPPVCSAAIRTISSHLTLPLHEPPVLSHSLAVWISLCRLSLFSTLFLCPFPGKWPSLMYLTSRLCSLSFCLSAAISCSSAVAFESEFIWLLTYWLHRFRDCYLFVCHVCLSVSQIKSNQIKSNILYCPFGEICLTCQCECWIQGFRDPTCSLALQLWVLLRLSYAGVGGKNGELWMGGHAF